MVDEGMLKLSLVCVRNNQIVWPWTQMDKECFREKKTAAGKT